MGKTAVLTIDDGPSSLTGELVEYLQAGMVLGNHGYSHRPFSSLNLTDAEQEIDRTEELLEAAHQRAGVPRLQRLFRFPYGDKGGTQRVEVGQLLARMGFDRLDTSAVTYPWFTEHGLNVDLDVFWTFDYNDYQLTQTDQNTSWADLWAHLEDPSPPLGGSLVRGDSGEILLLHDHPHTDVFRPGYFRDLLQRTIDCGVAFVAPQVSTTLPRL